MREIITMWRDGRMVAVTLVVAAIYTTALIPSKGLVIVPGFTTVRPAGVLPVVLGLMLGPAAAWGAAIGNLLSDAFGGTLTAGSAFGFAGNFFLGYAGYALWGNLGRLSSGEEPTMRSVRCLGEYLVVAAVAAAGTASIVAWGVDLLGLFPFPAIATVVFLNDFLAAALLGPPLLFLLYPGAKRTGVLYASTMDADDLPDVPATRQQMAAYTLAAVAVGWLAVGVLVGVGLEGVSALPDPTPGSDGGSPLQAGLGLVAFPALLACCALAGERLSALVNGSSVESSPAEPEAESEDLEAVGQRG